MNVARIITEKTSVWASAIADLRGDADVLGNAPVGVIVLARGEEEAIVPALLHPAPDQPVREPAAPVELQPALDEEMGGGDADRDRQDQREHADLDHHARHRARL